MRFVVSEIKTYIQKIKLAINPISWTYKTYLVTAFFLLGLNLFGPQGLIQFILIFQEEKRISLLIEERSKKRAELEKSILSFKKSDLAKLKVIRQDIGFLKSDEISFEITP